MLIQLENRKKNQDFFCKKSHVLGDGVLPYTESNILTGLLGQSHFNITAFLRT